MSALAPTGIVRAVYDSLPIVDAAGAANGEYFLFSIVGSSGSPVVFMETESGTSTSKIRALVGTSITLTVTGWDGTSEFVLLTSVSGSGTSYTATVSKED